MILWLWRGFVRYVIGVQPGPARLPRASRCKEDYCGSAVSPLCTTRRCPSHCRLRCPGTNGCESHMSRDELDLVERYRSRKLLEEVR